MIDRISGAGMGYIRLCFLYVLFGIASCASSGNGVAPICPEPEVGSHDYVIGAGDVLEIFVWREPELSGTIPVRPDGKISISLVEDMIAVGKTPTELARDMEQVLAEYLRLPKVNIIVVSEGAANQIQVIGNVVTPQSIPYRDDIRVIDVVVAVGGLDDFAAGNRSQIVRTVDGATTECKIRLNDLMRDGDMSQNIFMYPGDVLIIPESRFRGSMEEILKLLRREIVGAWRYRWWAMAVAWGVCALGWFTVYSMPDIYEANARFFVETRSRLDRVIGAVVVQDQMGGQVNLVKQAMLGRPVLEKVASDTDLLLRASTPLQRNDLISSLTQKIVITGSPGIERQPRPTDGIYTIAFRDSDRSMSLAVVNSLLNEFMDDVVRGRQDSSDETIKFLQSEIEKYDAQLEENERALADFKQANVGLLPGDGGGYFNRLQDELDELAVLEAQLENAQSRKIALQAQLRGANPFVADEDDDSGSTTTGPRTDLDTRIAELESQLDELLLRFTERHPDVVSTREQIAQLERRREEQLEMMRNAGEEDTAILATNPVYQQLSISLNEVDVEIAGLQSQVSRERAKIAELRARVDVIPAIEAELTELTRDYDQVKETYDELRGLLEQEVISSRKQEAAVVNFRLIDPPYVGTEPVSPQRALMLLAILVFGLGLGGSVAWVIHLLRPVFHDVSDLRESTGLPVLGAVSMTWIERHRSERRMEIASYTAAAVILLGIFVVAFVFREPGGVLVRQLLTGGSA